MSARYKVVNDNVHGYIRLHPVCVKIVDTPEFQRLRNLKQLGVVYFVYPGGSHNRFEHSLGVCHLAGKLVEALRRNSDETNCISDEEKLCLEVAGLCHDLGHGPFSHTWERFVERASSNDGAPVKWKHEESSVKMFEYLLKENGLQSELVSYFPKLKNDAVEFIKELIKGEGTLFGNKKYLYQIISNQENGIDVDRWDYILRDGRQLNLSLSFDYSRLLEFCRVVKFRGEKIICFNRKETQNIFDMFQVRFSLYYKAGHHNVVKTIEEMLIDAFIEADKNGYKIQAPNDKEYQLSKAHRHVDALSCMTDHIFYDILHSTQKKFEKARQLLHRILQRDLYGIVACRNFSTELQNKKLELNKNRFDQQSGVNVSEEIEQYEQHMKNDIKQICESKKHCKSEHFKVLMTALDMGVEIKGASIEATEKINPFRNIYFYDKKNLGKARVMEWKDITLLPVPEESLCHVHGLVIYKDIENPVRRNKELQKELQNLKDELNESWQSYFTSAKKLKLN